MNLIFMLEPIVFKTVWKTKQNKKKVFFNFEKTGSMIVMVTGHLIKKNLHKKVSLSAYCLGVITAKKFATPKLPHQRR